MILPTTKSWNLEDDDDDDDNNGAGTQNSDSEEDPLDAFMKVWYFTSKHKYLTVIFDFVQIYFLNPMIGLDHSKMRFRVYREMFVAQYPVTY